MILGQPGGRSFLPPAAGHAIEGHTLGGVLVQPFDKVCALHEHAARAAGRVEHLAMLRLDDVDDYLDKRDGRKKLPAVVRLLIRKLRQEVLIDAPKDVSVGTLECRVVEGAQDLPENIVVEFLIFGLGQGAARSSRSGCWPG